MSQIILVPISAKKASFNDAQMTTLNVLIELLIPASADGRMPSAKSLNLYANVADLPTQDRALFESGLAAIEARSQSSYSLDFSELSVEQAKALVDRLRGEGSAFIQSFMTQTAGRYLADDGVMILLGLEARPPWPKGNQVIEGDWTLLDSVRGMPKIYRQV